MTRSPQVCATALCPSAIQVYVKASALFRVSAQPYPYADACQGVKALVDAFGAERVMWGSDFPWVTEQCG